MRPAATSRARRSSVGIRARAAAQASGGTRRSSRSTPSKRLLSSRTATSPFWRTASRMARTAATGSSPSSAGLGSSRRRVGPGAAQVESGEHRASEATGAPVGVRRPIPRRPGRPQCPAPGSTGRPGRLRGMPGDAAELSSLATTLGELERRLGGPGPVLRGHGPRRRRGGAVRRRAQRAGRGPQRGAGPPVALLIGPHPRSVGANAVTQRGVTGRQRGENAATAPRGAVAHSDARRRIPASPSNQVAGTWLVLLIVLLLPLGASGVGYVTQSVYGAGERRGRCPPGRKCRTSGSALRTPCVRGG